MSSIFFIHVAGISQPHTISHYNTQHHRESFVLCIIALWHIPASGLCALKLTSSLTNSLAIRTTPTHLSSISNTAIHFTNLRRMEG